MAADLLFEIGVEELPASYVAAALDALPKLLAVRLTELRLEHGPIRALGTPRRVAVIVGDLADRQPDLDEELMGPPVRVAFDADGAPTRAAESFAERVGCSAAELFRRQTDKGEYLCGRRREAGRVARDLLPKALAEVAATIPFRKAMRWAGGEATFGRPVRWLCALHGASVVPVEFAGVVGGRVSYGHRFLAPDAIDIAAPSLFVDALRGAHVLVDGEERKRLMVERLHSAARECGGELVEDEFLVSENLSLVEEPHVVAGGYDRAFLELPPEVILAVARGHQRYFGVKSAQGTLLPRYLAVANTALEPDKITRGNDRVMRARLADARFFYDEDRARGLGDRRRDLDVIVFHKRLGSVGARVSRVERLSAVLGRALGLDERSIAVAVAGAALSKCDLTTLMVGELPELQGEMGRAYALAQGIDREVANVIAEHYLPRGAEDGVARSDAGALVAIADRLDTLAGCFAVGLVPTGAADPLALRRAAIGTLRTLLAREWDLSLADATREALTGYEGVKLDFSPEEAEKKLGGFFQQRLRGILADDMPGDVVDACLAVGAERPTDVQRRARALAELAPGVRSAAGEVFKRAANIAKDALPGARVAPEGIDPNAHATERELFDALAALETTLAIARPIGDYASALGAIAAFAPTLARYFDDVLVMADDEAIRANRLRVMRDVHATCSRLANFRLLA